MTENRSLWARCQGWKGASLSQPIFSTRQAGSVWKRLKLKHMLIFRQILQSYVLRRKDFQRIIRSRLNKAFSPKRLPNADTQVTELLRRQKTQARFSSNTDLAPADFAACPPQTRHQRILITPLASSEWIDSLIFTMKKMRKISLRCSWLSNRKNSKMRKHSSAQEFSDSARPPLFRRIDALQNSANHAQFFFRKRRTPTQAEPVFFSEILQRQQEGAQEAQTAVIVRLLLR